MKSNAQMDPSLNWTCGLSPDDYLECLDVATVHGFRLTDDGLHIDYMMASCDAHRARMEADFEHPMGSACGITGSRFVWPENYCYVDWGDEPSLTGEALEPVYALTAPPALPDVADPAPELPGTGADNPPTPGG